MARPRGLPAVWLGVEIPTYADACRVQGTFGFHEFALEDASKASQRAKAEALDQYRDLPTGALGVHLAYHSSR